MSQLYRLFFLLLFAGASWGATFQEAFDAWDDSLFLEVQNSYSGSDSTSVYWRNVVRFHRINHALFGHDADKDKKKAKILVKEAIAELDKLKEIASFRGEVEGLLATIRGIKITFNPITAVGLGPQVNVGMKKAFAADSANPRTLYLLGMSYAHTPAFLGGGFKKGKAHLLAAVKAYEREVKNGGVDPNWGYSTTVAFLGEIHRDKKEYETAKAWYTKALTINPKDQLAQLGLARLKEKQDE